MSIIPVRKTQLQLEQDRAKKEKLRREVEEQEPELLKMRAIGEVQKVSREGTRVPTKSNQQSMSQQNSTSAQGQSQQITFSGAKGANIKPATGAPPVRQGSARPVMRSAELAVKGQQIKASQKMPAHQPAQVLKQIQKNGEVTTLQQTYMALKDHAIGKLNEKPKSAAFDTSTEMRNVQKVIAALKPVMDQQESEIAQEAIDQQQQARIDPEEPMVNPFELPQEQLVQQLNSKVNATTSGTGPDGPQTGRPQSYFERLQQEKENVQTTTTAVGGEEDDPMAEPQQIMSQGVSVGNDAALSLPPKAPKVQSVTNGVETQMDNNQTYMDQIQTNLILQSMLQRRPLSADLERKKALIAQILEEEGNEEGFEADDILRELQQTTQ